MSTEITLQEYHLRYPNTAEVPTLVQSGEIGWLLAQERKKVLLKARRRARFQRACKCLFG